MSFARMPSDLSLIRGVYLRIFGTLLLSFAFMSVAGGGNFYSNFNPYASDYAYPNSSYGVGLYYPPDLGGPNCFPAGTLSQPSCFFQRSTAASFKSQQTGRLGSIVLAFASSLTVSDTFMLQIQLAVDLNGTPGPILETLTYTGPFTVFGYGPPYLRPLGVNSITHPVLTQNATYWLILSVPSNLAHLQNTQNEGFWLLAGATTKNSQATLISDETGISSTGVLVTCNSPTTPWPCNVWTVDTNSIEFAQPQFLLSDTSLPSIAGTSLPAGTQGVSYRAKLTAVGGKSPYTNWRVVSGVRLPSYDPSAGPANGGITLSISGVLPPGLTLDPSTGTISGVPSTTHGSPFTFIATTTDSTGATSPSQSFSITIGSAGAPTLSRSGVLSHIAAGGGWTTVITLANTSSAPIPVTVALHGDDGNPLTLPITTTQQGLSQNITAASLNTTMNPNTTMLISMGDQLASTVVGWADVSSSGTLGGYAIFRETPKTGSPSEGTVPLQSQFPSTITLPYDNTAGFVMGVAIANLSTSSANITATIWDDNGNQLGTQNITIAESGHTSFVLPNQLPLTTGKRGIVKFQSDATGGIAGLGLRFSPFGTFTSVPTL